MEKNFKKLVEEELLTEMPYVVLNKGLFDLEAEQFMKDHDFVGFVKKIKGIVDGKASKDKHNNELQIDSAEQKDEFVDHIKNDPTLPLAIWRLFIHWISETSSDK